MIGLGIPGVKWLLASDIRVGAPIVLMTSDAIGTTFYRLKQIK